MSVGTAVSIGKLVWDGGRVAAGASNPLGWAVSATMLFKKWVDSENAKLLEIVRQREACPHIVMLEGSPPTIVAAEYVRLSEGVAWKVGESALFFWHPDATFRPLVFTTAFVPGPRGAKSVANAAAFGNVIARPEGGYGCSQCRAVQQQQRG
jgi:hypothetical protein